MKNAKLEKTSRTAKNELHLINGSHLKKWITLEKRVTLKKLGQT